MRSAKTTTRARGVTTIPAAFRQTAHVETNTELIWVELEPQLWLVGPQARHPEEAAAVMTAALRAEQSPFPKLMNRWLSGRIGTRSTQAGTRAQAPELSEQQMIALGTTTTTP